MDEKVLAAINELRKAGKRIENFEEVLVIVLQALTGIAAKMAQDGLSDDELSQFEEFIDIVKSAIEYEKECRASAYDAAGGPDSRGDKNKAEKI